MSLKKTRKRSIEKSRKQLESHERKKLLKNFGDIVCLNAFSQAFGDVAEFVANNITKAIENLSSAYQVSVDKLEKERGKDEFIRRSFKNKRESN